PSDDFATTDLEALSNLQSDRGEKEHGSDTRRVWDKQVPAESALLDEICPLTPLEEAFWFLAHCEPERYDPYNVQSIVDCDGYLDINRFQNALQGVMNRHESLRVYFDSNEFGNGMQIVTTQANVPFEIVDLSDVDHVQQNEISNRIEIDDRKLRFDLA